MSCLCSGLNMNIGIPACGVVSINNKAAAVTPGVFAISAKVGALKFGESSCPFWVA